MSVAMNLMRAAVAYFAPVFAGGFLLGALRVTFTAPRWGPFAATLLELPPMLLLSWLVCRWAVRRFAVPARPASRLAMGGIAFALLMAAELGLGVFGFGETPAAHWARYAEPASQLGLAGQLGFALMPLLALLRRG